MLEGTRVLILEEDYFTAFFHTRKKYICQTEPHHMPSNFFVAQQEQVTCLLLTSTPYECTHVCRHSQLNPLCLHL